MSEPKREIIELGYITCTGASLGEVVQWAEERGAPLEDVALEPYPITSKVFGVVAVWYGVMETVQVPSELL